MTCRQLMTPAPSCCEPADNVVSAAMIMKNHDIGSVPVVLDRASMRVVGMVTDRDLTLRVVAEQRDYYNTRVEDVMSRDVITCSADDNYNEVIAAMKEHQIRRIPVVDSGKRLVGIIAIADVARESLVAEDVGVVVEEISKPAPEPEMTHDGHAANYAKAGLLLAGGLGVGAGLIYLLDPRWARRAVEAVKETVTRHGDQ